MSTTTQIALAPVVTTIAEPDDPPLIRTASNTTAPHAPPAHPARLSRLLTAHMIFTLSGVNFTNSAVNGLVGVGLPAITADLDIPPHLAFWPASVSALATASALLLSGSIATAVGPRWVDLAGCFAGGALIVGAGLVGNGEGLVALRALQGAALALHLSSSVAIVAENLPSGRARNVAFSCLGLSQPLGYSFGLLLGGVFVDTVGWRAGWYLFGAITLALSTLGLWSLPESRNPRSAKRILRDVTTKVDWVGALLASCFMASLSYILAVISTDLNQIRSPTAITLLCLTVLSVTAFPFWIRHQTRLGRPALIPNSIWGNAAFSCTCASIILSYAVVNCMELFASFFFQNIQHLSALQASIRIAPSLVVSVLINMTIGLFVHKVPALWLVVVSSVLCAGAPVLMAVAPVDGIYWAHPFVAQLLQPVSFGVLFTVGLLVVSDAFGEDMQALAGAVFNVAGQFGTALGLSILQVVSTIEENKSPLEGEGAMLHGYRASFWAMFAFMIICGAIGGLGMWKVGKVGLKRD